MKYKKMLFAGLHISLWELDQSDFKDITPQRKDT